MQVQVTFLREVDSFQAGSITKVDPSLAKMYLKHGYVKTNAEGKAILDSIEEEAKKFHESFSNKSVKEESVKTK